MNYFRVFSIVWGVLMVSVRLLIHVIPESWTRFELGTVYKEERPAWIWLLAVKSVAIVGLTWYVELTTQVRWSMIVTVLVTLTLAKLFQLVFNYQNFRSFVKKALMDERSIIAKRPWRCGPREPGRTDEQVECDGLLRPIKAAWPSRPCHFQVRLVTAVEPLVRPIIGWVVFS